ncbi:MAG: carbon-nitrogen hydrolase family protein, partial [Candidatus Hodarchaeota archaeon]
MKFRIVAAQIKSKQADPHHNLETISAICQKREISEDPNTIVIFPELSVTGYLMYDDVFNLAEKVPSGPLCTRLSEITRNNNCYLIAGLPEASIPGLIYNSAVFFGPKGFLGKARKILLPDHSVFDE